MIDWGRVPAVNAGRRGRPWRREKLRETRNMVVKVPRSPIESLVSKLDQINPESPARSALESRDGGW